MSPYRTRPLPTLIAPPASPWRRAVAYLRGIRRRMYVANVRRRLARALPAAPWSDRQETAKAIWENPQNAEAILVMMKVQYHPSRTVQVDAAQVDYAAYVDSFHAYLESSRNLIADRIARAKGEQ